MMTLELLCDDSNDAFLKILLPKLGTYRSTAIADKNAQWPSISPTRSDSPSLGAGGDLAQRSSVSGSQVCGLSYLPQPADNYYS